MAPLPEIDSEGSIGEARSGHSVGGAGRFGNAATDGGNANGRNGGDRT